MPDLVASIDVPAPPGTVWAVLLDTDRYPAWNTTLRVRGEYAVGESVRATLSVPGLPRISFSPTVVELEPERELRWQSRLFGHEAEHTFRLEPLADGGTRFVQTETFDGPLAGPVVGRLDRRLRRGFEQLNVGLRREAVAATEP